MIININICIGDMLKMSIFDAYPDIVWPIGQVPELYCALQLDRSVAAGTMPCPTQFSLLHSSLFCCRVQTPVRDKTGMPLKEKKFPKRFARPGQTPERFASPKNTKGPPPPQRHGRKHQTLLAP
jgi:hypothetical protein